MFYLLNCHNDKSINQQVQRSEFRPTVLPQVFCVVDVEIPQLVEETARLAEEEEGGLDVEHRVEVLKQQLLLVLDITCGKFLDRLVVIMVSTRL